MLNIFHILSPSNSIYLNIYQGNNSNIYLYGYNNLFLKWKLEKLSPQKNRNI